MGGIHWVAREDRVFVVTREVWYLRAGMSAAATMEHDFVSGAERLRRHYPSCGAARGSCGSIVRGLVRRSL